MLYYISTADLLGKRAHAIQQMQMCQAFVQAGEQVCFVHPVGSGDATADWSNLSTYYGLTERFDVHSIPTYDDYLPERTGIVAAASAISRWLYKQAKSGGLDSDDTIYARNYYATFGFLQLRRLLPESQRPKVIVEYHQDLSARFKQRFFERVDGVVAITRALKQFLIQTHGVSPSDCLVAPDGVNMSPYETNSKEEARNEVGIPMEEDVVMYTGNLYPANGVSLLVDVADQLDAEVYVVGGMEEDIRRIKSHSSESNVTFTGFIKPPDIPSYQLAADVLVSTYTWNVRPRCSPLKLFEYMAAGRPIVSSDIPVFREVLVDGSNSLLFEPEDGDALVDAVNRILQNTEVGERLGRQARAEAEKYSWENRAERIVSFLSD
jgi:glycosyltransferase involved in cell wall biosynthesis